VRELVSALILATRSHQVDRASPFLLKVMNDIDMAILAAPPAEYQDYARKLWLEYSRIGRDLYLRGRLAFLSRLDPRTVFATEPYIRKVIALRKNLSWEVRALTERPELVLGSA
jgi:predicted metal-dependent HD superfamily phosphohydrolase